MRNPTRPLLIFCFLLYGCATAPLSKNGQRKTAGRTFVIAGASSGFGRGVAVQLGQYHANVVLAARRTDLLEEVAAEVRKGGGTALVVTADISKQEDVQRLADAAVKQFGHVDVWINNAGIAAIGPFWEIPVEEHARLIDINLKGVIYGSHAAIKLFRAQGHGVLINTGSVESEIPLAYQSSYSASKAGVRSLGEALHQELRLSGDQQIRVVTIMPWVADTPWWKHAANHSGGQPRMLAVEGPEKVVNAIIYASLHRRRELPVGWKARTSYIAHHVFPHLTERISGNINHRYQIMTAPPAPPTSGSLFTPVEEGRGVNDSLRWRMKTENKQRRKN